MTRLSIEERFWSKVNKTDDCWEWLASKNAGYGAFWLANRAIPSRRFSYELVSGPTPYGLFIDHICHNRACVNPDHLRLASIKQNAEHRVGAQRNNKSSGVRGVYWHERNGMWRGVVTHQRKFILVGYFHSIAEAEASVIAKRNELFTHNDKDRVAA